MVFHKLALLIFDLNLAVLRRPKLSSAQLPSHAHSSGSCSGLRCSYAERPSARSCPGSTQFAVLGGRIGMVARRRSPHAGAQCATQLALVRAVHRGLSNGLTCALQRRNMICHKLSSLNPHICRENGMQDRKVQIRHLASHGLPKLPAISKFTELRPSGQPCLGQNTPISNERCNPTRSHPTIPPAPFKSIHICHLTPTLPRSTLQPIFDTSLALPAIPVAVKGRSQCATSQCPLIPYKTPKSTGQALNPASPDGGQHTT